MVEIKCCFYLITWSVVISAVVISADVISAHDVISALTAHARPT